MLKRLAGKLIYRVAKTPLGIASLLWSVNHMSFVLPIDRLRETANLIAIYNPKPAYPVHIIIIPKRPIESLMKLSPADGGLLVEVIQTVQSLVEELKLDRDGYRLIVNGGKYQTVQQLHFHLVSGDSIR